MKKLLNTLLLSIVLVLVSATFVSAKPFNDLPSTHWAYKYVNPMVEKGIVNGYDGNVFKPNGNVTRAEWAKLLTFTANIPIHGDFEEIMKNACLDAKPTSWHAAYTVALLPYFDYSFAEGDNGELYFTCEASKPVTRLEIAKSIVRVAGYTKLTPDYDLIKGFRDYSKIPEDDRKYIAIAVQKGIVSGFDDNTFRPFDNVTRAQASTMLFRTFFGEEKPIETPEKPYIVNKLVDASIEYAKEATLDESGNFFFIDNVDNRVYVVNLETKERKLYYDPNSLTHIHTNDDGTEVQYSGYKATQVYYDTYNDILFLNGHFTSAVQPGKIPANNKVHCVFYDITDGKCELYCEPIYDYNGTPSATIQSSFDSKHIIIARDNSSYLVKVNIKTGEEIQWMSGVYSSNAHDEGILTMRYNNGIYYFDHIERNSIKGYEYCDLMKYNFLSGNFDKLTSFEPRGVGFKGAYFYFWIYEDMTMYKINVENLMITPVGVTFDDKKIEFADMGSLTKINTMFYIIDDNTLIFYDYEMEAFRILGENKVEIEEFVPPTFNTATYYTYLKKFDASNYNN